jgi:hypothetical protein
MAKRYVNTAIATDKDNHAHKHHKQTSMTSMPASQASNVPIEEHDLSVAKIACETSTSKCDDADLARHVQMFRAWPQLAQRAAFYAGVWRIDRFSLPLHKAHAYGKLVMVAIEEDHRIIAAGGLPQKLRPEVALHLTAHLQTPEYQSLRQTLAFDTQNHLHRQHRNEHKHKHSSSTSGSALPSLPEETT